MADSRVARIGRAALVSLEWLAVAVVVLLLLAMAGVAAVLWWPYQAPAELGASAAGAVPTGTMPTGTMPTGAMPAGAASASTVPTSAGSSQASGAANSNSLFSPIAQVLTSPRCMNCHPAGQRPLWRNGEEHPMNLSRTSFASGLACQTCHQQSNAGERLQLPGGPPGAPHWQLPPRDMPMVFQGLSETTLCQQLRDPQHNGGKSLDALLLHVQHDPLVLWGFKPGGKRSKPPLSHSAFVAAFKTWVQAEGRCPGDEETDADKPPE